MSQDSQRAANDLRTKNTQLRIRLADVVGELEQLQLKASKVHEAAQRLEGRIGLLGRTVWSFLRPKG